jgi:hypothetical protein
MPRQLGIVFASLLILAAAVPAAQAQWPSDPTENLLLADHPSRQIVPKVSSLPDGGAYVGWYDMASGNYDIYLQRLDAHGVEQWPHNGILVSGHRQDTWVMDWQLITDSKGGAVLAFADIREGTCQTIHAYRISRNGKMLWGPNGITLSLSNSMSTGVRIVEASDGDFVFVWSVGTELGSGNLMMQRVSPQGDARFEGGGLLAVNGQGLWPGWPDIVAAEDGSVIVSWITDLNLISAEKFLRAEKFGPAGESVWGGPVTVFDAFSLPVAHFPRMTPDGNGGAFLVWHYVPFLIYNSAVQHLDADGTELWGDNGVDVSTNPFYNHLDPTMTYNAETGDLLVFWEERNANQSAWGIFGQKFSVDGRRMWGDQGLELLPVERVELLHLLSLPCENGALLFFSDRPKGGLEDRVMGMRIEANGKLLWPGGTIEVGSYLSIKGHPALTVDRSGAATIVWDDQRDGDWNTVDIYGQKVNLDGTLGN